MAETNGSGRMDRIEAMMETMIQHHDTEFKHLMTWQVLTQDTIREMGAKVDLMAAKVDNTSQHLRILSEQTDRRFSQLVSAIGELIKRLPVQG